MSIPTISINRLGEHVGEDVEIRGWLHNRRSSGKIHFLVVRDGSGFLQVVMGKNDVGEDAFKAADHLAQETSIIVRGNVRADARAKGGHELIASGFDVVGVSHDYPITPKEHGVDYLMDRRHLWIRAERQTAILKVRHEVINAVRDFFNGEGFILADTPIFTPAACEGTTTLFPVQYFDDTTAYLTQSGQLYNEANAMALGKVYCFGPTFRAEKSKTRRHLTEFWMVEPEMAYADLNDVMDLAERLVDERRRARARPPRQRAEAARARHHEARSGEDAVPAHDLRRGSADCWSTRASRSSTGPTSAARTRRCCRSSSTRRSASPHYPSAVKAFYMKPDPQQLDRALCVDVLAPEGYGEIIGGGQRLDDLDLLLARIKQHELPQEAFEWYLDLRRYGTVPHGGFGMGIERVRDVAVRPRTRPRDHPLPAHAVPLVSVVTGTSPAGAGYIASPCALPGRCRLAVRALATGCVSNTRSVIPTR